jgi:proteic killer suppression protein
MNIEFDNTAMEELYTNGETQDHEYKKLSKNVVKQYIKVVNYIRSVRRLEDYIVSSRSTMRKRRVISMALMLFG